MNDNSAKKTTECGLSCWHPKWLQSFANTRSFIIVYGLLGTVQGMSFLYLVVTLTSIEKRFKFPSSTTGLILSGNEISQILFSGLIAYFGGHRNRPRLIATGVLCAAISCFVLALPHLIYGPGEDALKLTKEYQEEMGYKGNETDIFNTTILSTAKSLHDKGLCTLEPPLENECEGKLVSFVPAILIFVSQFILGIGNSLYFSLGQTYIDDNTKKTNTPIMLSYAFALRLLGPVAGFPLGYLALRIYIDPSKTPLIDVKDPRWLGAWWLGWIVLGLVMMMFSFLIALFPKELPRKKSIEIRPKSGVPRVLKNNNINEEENPLKDHYEHGHIDHKPSIKEFPASFLRLLKNKLLMFNTFAAIFYILGSSGYITFLAKYIEVQFHKNKAESTIITGPVILSGMMVGLLGSGFVISRYKPRPKYLLFWNVIVGLIYVIGQFTFMFLTCSNPPVNINEISTSCNSKCHCEDVAYSPVCYEDTKTTYFSACHIGCRNWESNGKYFQECTCIEEGFKDFEGSIENEYDYTEENTTETIEISTEKKQDFLKFIPGACVEGCAIGFILFTGTAALINTLGSSARIGNVLVNYRCVEYRDKAFTQGIILTLVSLFGFIPGPIIYGKIIDMTCLIWTENCGKQGDCQLYDQDKFRYYINSMAVVMTTIGAFLDALVWHYGKNLDLYGDNEDKENENKFKRLNK